MKRLILKFLRSGYQIDARFFQVEFSRGVAGFSKLWVGSGWGEGWCLLCLASIWVGGVSAWPWGTFEKISIMKTCTCTQKYTQHFSGRVRKSIDCRVWNCLGRPRSGFGCGGVQPMIMRCVTGMEGMTSLFPVDDVSTNNDVTALE